MAQLDPVLSQVILVLLLSALGAVAGFFAGLLGIGGGAVLVPGLYYVFKDYGFTESAMHVAVATSVVSIVFTGASSTRAHYRLGNLDRDLLKQFLPGIAFGSIVASFLIGQLSTQALIWVFAGLQLAFGSYMLVRSKTIALFSRLPKQPWFSLIAAINGLTATIMGVGGGVQNVLFLTLCSYPLKPAIGTSAGVGFCMAIVASLGYMFSSAPQASVIPGTLGLVNIFALIPIVCMSILTAPIGAKLVARLPQQLIKRIFTLFVLVISIKMLLAH